MKIWSLDPKSWTRIGSLHVGEQSACIFTKKQLPGAYGLPCQVSTSPSHRARRWAKVGHQIPPRSLHRPVPQACAKGSECACSGQDRRTHAADRRIPMTAVAFKVARGGPVCGTKSSRLGAHYWGPSRRGIGPAWTSQTRGGSPRKWIAVSLNSRGPAS